MIGTRKTVALLAAAFTTVAGSAWAGLVAPGPVVGDGVVGFAVLAATAVGYLALRARRKRHD